AKANLPRCLEAGSRMPARAGREGAFAAGLARDDRLRWSMRLGDLEEDLRERDCVFHRQGGAHAIWFKNACRGVYFAGADFGLRMISARLRKELFADSAFGNALATFGS